VVCIHLGKIEFIRDMGAGTDPHITVLKCEHPEISVPYCVETQAEKNIAIGSSYNVCEGCPLRKEHSVIEMQDKSNFCYFTGTNRAADIPLIHMLLKSARDSGVSEDFHLFSPWKVKGFEFHEIPKNTPWRNHLAKLDFLRKLENTTYDYCVWLDADNYFVRHPGNLKNLIRDNPCWISMEGELTSPKVRWPDWWTMKFPQVLDIMKSLGCSGKKIWSTNGGMWIVRRTDIKLIADLVEGIANKMKATHPMVSDEPPLAVVGQTLVPNYELNTVQNLSDVWACDWVGNFKDKLPDGKPWKYEDWMTAEQSMINPAIVHSMRGKDTVRRFINKETQSKIKVTVQAVKETNSATLLDEKACKHRRGVASTDKKSGIQIYRCPHKRLCVQTDEEKNNLGNRFVQSCGSCDLLELNPPTILPQKAKPLSMIERAKSFASTMVNTAVQGKLAPQSVIDERFKICEQCSHLIDGGCDLCGCNVTRKQNLLNKLANISSRCPDNPPRWNKAE